MAINVALVPLVHFVVLVPSVHLKTAARTTIATLIIDLGRRQANRVKERTTTHARNRITDAANNFPNKNAPLTIPVLDSFGDWSKEEGELKTGIRLMPTELFGGTG